VISVLYIVEDETKYADRVEMGLLLTMNRKTVPIKLSSTPPFTGGQRTGASLDFLDNSEACRYRIRVALLLQRLHKPLYRLLKPEG
jgi:hypothetical protein